MIEAKAARFSSPSLWLAAGAYLLLHALAILLTLPSTLRGSYPFLILVSVPAWLACIRQSRRGSRTLRVPWLLAASAMAVWCEAMAVSALEYFSAGKVETFAGVADLLFLLYTVPLLLVLTSSIGGPWQRLFVWLDLAQILYAASLLYVLVFARLPFQPLPPQPLSMPTMLVFYNTINFGLALVATFRAVLHARHTGGGQLFRVLTAFLWTYAICAAINNYLVSKLADKTTYIDLLGDIPFLLLTVLMLRLPHATASRTTAMERRITRYIDNASPVAYTIALGLLSAASLHRHYRLGLTGMGLALIAYAVRATVLQNRFIRSERLLKEANLRLEDLSLKDALTGVANRRRFDQTAAREWSGTSSSPLSLLLLDLDHFKALNDRYGHRAGDDCLTRVAAALRSVLPEERGLLARYGGEEFAALLWQTDPSAALATAESMRSAVAALEIAHAGAAHGFVTVSIGVATRTGSPQEFPFSSLVEEADQALYRAKEAGRNCVNVLP